MQEKKDYTKKQAVASVLPLCICTGGSGGGSSS
jgi:hypothetical protein